MGQLWLSGFAIFHEIQEYHPLSQELAHCGNGYNEPAPCILRAGRVA